MDGLVGERLASASRLVTDGLSCWFRGSRGRPEDGDGHQQRRAGGGLVRRSDQVNATLGNVKAAIASSLPRYVRNLQRFLASYTSRFDRRFQLDSLIPRLVYSAGQDRPLPYAKLVAG